MKRKAPARAHSARDGYTVIERPLLSERTSMGVGGEAIAEIRVHDVGALEAVPALAKELGGEIVILGRGSNLLVKEGKLPLVLVCLETNRQPYVMMQKGSVLLRVNADIPLSALLGRAAALGFSGLEGLSGIPGNAGGAMAMNAGSYGVSMADVVRSAEVFTPGLGLVELDAEQFLFSYRFCDLRKKVSWFLIAGMTLELGRDEPPVIKARMAETMSRKKATQPISARSAGCVFKNPEGHSAGKLLDEAGMRGKGLDSKGKGMRFSQVHANFLVNEGQGTFEQAEALIAEAKAAVSKRFGISLELEVRIWP